MFYRSEYYLAVSSQHMYMCSVQVLGSFFSPLIFFGDQSSDILSEAASGTFLNKLYSLYHFQVLEREREKKNKKKMKPSCV